MDNDMLMVIGIVLSGLSIPSLLAAFRDGRAPRIGGIMLMVGLVMAAAALSRQPNGYTFAEIANAFQRVIARFL